MLHRNLFCILHVINLIMSDCKSHLVTLFGRLVCALKQSVQLAEFAYSCFLLVSVCAVLKLVTGFTNLSQQRVALFINSEGN